MLPSHTQFFSRFLTNAWQEINHEALQDALELPAFQIDESKSRLGFWDLRTRTLGIAARLLLKHSEMEILEVLKHEMAHQYADEVLGSGHDPTETAHGSAFRHAAQRLGIQHHARYAAHRQASPILRRIQKLLALTQSENPHEAQSAMIKARDLMAKYEVDSDWEHQDLCHNFLGQGLPRKSMQAQLIASILSRFFNVAVIWIPSEMPFQNKTVWLLEASGTSANLEVAGYVHDFLHRELAQLWKGHRSRNPSLKGMRAKRDFQVGVLKGLIEKLSKSQQPDTQSSQTLMVQKKEKLNQFLYHRHPDMQRGRRMKYRTSAAYHAGLEEGRNLDIHRGLKRNQGETKALSSG